MGEKRQTQLENLKEPKTLGGLVSMTTRLEAKLRGFRLESVGTIESHVDSRKHNKRGEEVESSTGYIYPLPSAE